MDKKNLMPHQAQPITRITTGQLSAELAELSEEALSQSLDICVLASGDGDGYQYGRDMWCSYDGEDAE